MRDVDLQIYTRESIAQDFMPETPDGIREFYATVLESSSIDIMIGAVYAEHLLALLTARDLTLREIAKVAEEMSDDNGQPLVVIRDRILALIGEVK
jgi:hypothetical protein